MDKNSREMEWTFSNQWSGSVIVKRIFIKKRVLTPDGPKDDSIPIYVRRMELTYASRNGKDMTIRFPAHKRHGVWTFGDSREKQSPMRNVREMRNVLVPKIGESNADRMLFAVMGSL